MFCILNKLNIFLLFNALNYFVNIKFLPTKQLSIKNVSFQFNSRSQIIAWKNQSEGGVQFSFRGF